MASSWPATAYMLQRKDSPALLRAPLVHDIARKLGKKPSQVLLNWAIAHGTTVSPKAGSFEHVQVGPPAPLYRLGCLKVHNCMLPSLVQHRSVSLQGQPGLMYCIANPGEVVLSS